MGLIDVEVTGTTIRAVEPTGDAVEIEVSGWDSPAPPLDLEAALLAHRASISGRATKLLLPKLGLATVDELGEESTGTSHTIGPDQQTVELSDGSYRVRNPSSPQTMLRFDGRARVHGRGDGKIEVSFPHPTVVTVAFSPHVSLPEHTLTVPETTEGLATAVTNFSASLGTDVPYAVRPADRGHPPLVRFGDGVSIPAAVRDAGPDTDVEFLVPDSVAHLLVVAPLAYYLGATVTVADRDRPLLRDPATGFSREFGRLPAVQSTMSDLLWRVSLLDLVVHVQNRGRDFREWDVIGRFDLDPARLSVAGPVERLRTYLDVPTEPLQAVLPDWHYRVYVDPRVENGRILPFALDRLAQVHVTDGARETAGGAASWSPAGDGVSDPADHFVGWLGDDPPPNAHRTSVTAAENALDHLETGAEPERVIVVDNAASDESRSDRAATAVDAFEWSKTFDFEVEYHRDVGRVELTDLFASDSNLLYYAGERGGGLDCPDGRLDLSTVEQSGAHHVFLDGTGHRGYALDHEVRGASDSGSKSEDPAAAALVAAGSAAVVVRDPALGSGLSPEHRRTFFTLLAAGFATNHARRLTRYFADEQPDLAVVGAGLSRLSEHTTVAYSHAREVDPLGDGRFDVTVHDRTRDAGFYWQSDIDDELTLVGGFSRLRVDANGIRTLLMNTDDQIVVDGRVYDLGPDDVFGPLV